MIVVDINLDSAHGPHCDEKLGRLEICNDGTGTPTRGNYNVRLYSRGEHPRLIRTARVENWPRQQHPAWRLISAAFQALEA